MKFRIYSTIVNGYLYPHKDTGLIVVDHNNKPYLVFENQLEPCDDVVIEFSAGVKDINGREVYQGDILDIWIQGIQQEQVYIVQDTNKFYLDLHRDDSYLRISEFEVIGNIHERN